MFPAQLNLSDKRNIRPAFQMKLVDFLSGRWKDRLKCTISSCPPQLSKILVPTSLSCHHLLITHRSCCW